MSNGKYAYNIEYNKNGVNSMNTNYAKGTFKHKTSWFLTAVTIKRASWCHQQGAATLKRLRGDKGHFEGRMTTSHFDYRMLARESHCVCI